MYKHSIAIVFLAALVLTALSGSPATGDTTPAQASLQAAPRADDPAKADEPAQADEPAKAKPQTICPVMGNPINKEIFVDYQGKRAYFCCKGCIPEFNKDPEKYMKIMRDQGVEPEDAPAPAK